MNIKLNVENVKKNIEAVCKKNSIEPGDIKLLAVTKTRSVEEIESVIGAGISIIGENKVQEAESKLPEIRSQYSEFHFIGHLQSNKVKKLLALKPDLIHSIDSVSTLRKINELASKSNRIQKVLIQVNTSGEESKFGIDPDSLNNFIDSARKFTNIQVLGLMTIGRFTDNELEIRKCFRKLTELFKQMKDLELSNIEMKYLSMGMSHDYEIALEEGANIIRIGSALFGPRIY